MWPGGPLIDGGLIRCPDCNRLISPKALEHECTPIEDPIVLKKEDSLERGFNAIQNRQIRESEGKGYHEMQRRARKKLQERKKDDR